LIADGRRIEMERGRGNPVTFLFPALSRISSPNSLLPQPHFTISEPTIILWHSYSLPFLVSPLPTPSPLFLPQTPFQTIFALTQWPLYTCLIVYQNFDYYDLYRSRKANVPWLTQFVYAIIEILLLRLWVLHLFA
jgi:hypothetical protein